MTWFKKCGRLRLKCDGTRAETRFYLSAKRTSPFKSARASVQSTTGNRSVRISGSNAGYTMFRGSVKSTGYPLHSPVSPSLPLPCVVVCHHISTGLYQWNTADISRFVFIYVAHVTGEALQTCGRAHEGLITERHSLEGTAPSEDAVSEAAQRGFRDYSSRSRAGGRANKLKIQRFG